MGDKPTVLFQGNEGDRSSFSIVTGHLVRGLRDHGFAVTVFPNTEGAAVPELPAPPGIYIFQGFNYDAKNAPGRFNVFCFTYEYPDLERQYAPLIARLNAYFDLVVTPSAYVAEICRRNGVTIPVEVVPHGVDPAQFHATAPPATLPTAKRFRFLNLGGMFDRKGTDVLLRAYIDEFSSEEDVALIVKARGYELAWGWAEQVLRQARLDRRGAPEVVVLREDVASVAGYYTAADCGVFPHRGEGFGLPILESLACGTPVIVTGGTGEMDYCSPRNAAFIGGSPRLWTGRRMVEPDVASLRRLLREAFERGPLTEAARSGISRSVSRFTWERSSKRFAKLLRRAREKRIPSSSGSAPAVTYSFSIKGRVSWQRSTLEIDSLLRRRFTTFQSVPYTGALRDDRSDLVVGQSEFCLEAFLRSAAANPKVCRILHQEGTALERRIEITNKERKRCGVAPILKRPIEIWRNRMECDLVDYIVVASRASADYFLRAGHPRERVRVIPWGIDLRDPVRPRKHGKRRFLFAGTEPFRKGVRVLFEAWNALRPPGAELWCYTNEEMLQSEKLLGYIVANPSIIVKPLIPHRQFLRLLREVDCQVLPSYEDSFSFVIGDGMGCGIPAIISDETGIADLMTDGESGRVVKTGSVQALMAALDDTLSNPRHLRSMGEGAYEAARLYPWMRFRSEFFDLCQECLQAAAARG